MRLSRLLTMGLIAGVAVATLLLATDGVAPRTSFASYRAPSMVAGGSGEEPPSEALQTTDNADDQRIEVMLWTVFAAGGAMAVGLVLLLVRIALGGTRPPPAEEEAPRH